MVSIDNGDQPMNQNNDVVITTNTAVVQCRMPSLQKKKIPRPCTFCNKMQTNLTRHIKVVHKTEKAVAQASQLPFDDRCQFFANLRKTGILQYDGRQMKCQKPSYARERNRTMDNELVMCGECSGFYAKKYFRRHRKKCNEDQCSVPRALSVQLMKVDAMWIQSSKLKFWLDLAAILQGMYVVQILLLFVMVQEYTVSRKKMWQYI